jgi:hypothetical protein
MILDMRKFDWDLVSDDRGLALLTVPSITKIGEMHLADFRDTKALAYKNTQHFLGISKNRGIRLGGHPLRMIDGVWYIEEDRMTGVEDLQISHESLCLQFIR